MDAHTYIRAGFLAVLAGSVPVTADAAENTFVYDNIAGWTIRTDVDREYRCYAEAEYTNGSVVRAGFNSDDGAFYMSVGDYSWDWVREGVSYSIDVGFDDGSEDRFTATGTVVEGDYTYPSVRVDLPTDKQEQFIRQFMHQHEMRVAYGDETSVTLGLDGTWLATRTLDECRLEMLSAVEEASSPNDNSSASLE